MAGKRQSDSPKQSNKIRFVLLEADLSDGNLSELTHAITNALKPSVQAPSKLLTRTAAQVLPPATDDIPEAEVEEAEEPELTNSSTPPAAEKKPAQKKKYKQPEYVELDWTGTGGSTFKDFAREKNPKSKARKYLVAT